MAALDDTVQTKEENIANGATLTPAAAKSSTLLSPEQHLGSSPLLKDSGSKSAKYQNTKFRNSTSSFRLSKDLANIRWDGPELKEDDIIFKDGEGYASSEEETENGSDADNDEADANKLGSRTASDAAQYSTISKRADFILANAKKKLNLLEGNLGKARHSLASPQPVSELRTQSSLSSYPSTDDEERSVRLRPRINFAPSRRGRVPPPIRKTSAGHSRMYSDTSVPSPTGTSIKGSRSLDHLNNPETIPSPLHEGVEFEEADEALEESPTSQEAVQVESVEPIVDDPAVSKRQSIHAIRELYGANSPAPKSTQELRDQADELRTRIAFLQKRSQNSGPPGGDPAAERNEKLFQAQVDALQRSLEDQESVIEQLEAAERERSQGLEDDPRGEWHQVLSRNEDRGSGSEFSEDEYDEYDDGEVPDALADEDDDDDNKSMDGAHEDRLDAFDYEHFILHSGMVLPANSGSGSQSDALSQRTASTERGGVGTPGAAEDQAYPGTVESWEAFQQPNDSIASLTTMQSFETAAEINDSSSDLGSDASEMQNEELLQTGRLQDPWPMPPAVNGDTQRAAFRESQLPTPRAASFSKSARNSTLSADAALRPVSAIVKSLMKRDSESIETRPLEREDDELIRSTAEGLRSVCQELVMQQTSARDMQALRERLEVARRILAGEL